MSGTTPSRKSVDQLLSDFDNLGTGAPGGAAGGKNAGGQAHKDAQSLLDDLDSLVQAPRAPATGSSPAAPATAPASAPAQASAPALGPAFSQQPTPSAAAPQQADAQLTPSASGTSSTAGWGSWGSVWSSAARLADQARAEIEKRAPPLTVSGISADGSIQTEKSLEGDSAATAAAQQATAQAAAAAQGVLGRGFKFAEGVRGYVKESGWDKIGEDLTRAGRKGLKDIINAVAPPISAHEVLQVTLSHDMIGYDGIETVVFQVLAKVMEQVDRNDIEHQLVVNKAHNRPGGSLPKQQDEAGAEQNTDLNAVEGFEAAFKLAEAELAALIKARPASVPEPAGASSQTPAPVPASASGTAPAPDQSGDSKSLTLPVTECPLFIRVQPLVAPLPGAPESTSSTASPSAASKYLFFVILLHDPLHGLRHQVISSSIPWSWMSVSLETNAWVEQALVDVLHGALSIVGQDYVHGRSVTSSA
ncbi:hypothetical protein V8E36_002472 [Tilletia maclaganii]